MTEPTEPKPRPPARAPKKRPSIADVFGDVLPEVTSDERTPEPGATSTDTWYQDNRPPHHEG